MNAAHAPDARATLADLQHGQTARILAIETGGDAAVRLHALGLLPRRLIRRENTAPLGDPVAFLIEEQKVSIRLADARAVAIELL